MKELTTEQKAKAYDKAIKKAESLYKVAEPMSGCNVIIETLFPSFKKIEDKDKRIIKALIQLVRDYPSMDFFIKYNIHLYEITNWLEQREQETNDDEDILQRFSFYSYKDEPNILYLAGLYVNDEYRNKGIGTKILKIADEVAASMKCNSILLKTEIDSNAERLYKNNGYSVFRKEGNQVWLKKQGNITKLNVEEYNKFAKSVLSNCAMSFINYLDAHKYEGKMCVSNGECEDIENAFRNAMWDRLHRYYCKYIEKQGEQEQLYIRFGEIPTDEKSKIYQGEIEVGTENGVSVYPAFKLNGNIVLGLTLPITKTTLYTQQHLLEYDNRPCYLVKGNYIGKDTDGQPLINNVSVIEKIDNYRVKEEKQDEQKSDKVEPKFKNGQWIVWQNKCYKVNDNGCGYKLIDQNGLSTSLEYGTIDESARLWDITKDAKDCDVLHASNFSFDCIFIFDRLDNWEFDEPNGERAVATGHCCLTLSADNIEFCIQGPDCIEVDTVKPATNIQRNLLEKAMADAGYTFDFEKKELKKIEPEECCEDNLPDFESIF